MPQPGPEETSTEVARRRHLLAVARGDRIDAGGRPVVPGFVDAHVHIESSKLVPAEFARMVVPRGTTSVVVDPHEVANVLGRPGVDWFLESARGLPLDVLAMAPSCVPASPLESPKVRFTPEDVAALSHAPGMLGVAEMMNFPAVVAGDEDELRKLVLSGRPADGHAPGLQGRALDAYVAAGIATDHEATRVEEALAKRRRGLWVLLREASNARNLLDLLPLVLEHGPDWCAFCTDDREPTTLLRDGHLDEMCRMARAAGVAAEEVLLLASTHPARCHGLHDRGLIAPGRRADLVVLEDTEAFRAEVVIAGGRVVARDGVATPFAAPPIPDWVRASFSAAPLVAEELRLAAPSDGAAVRVIGLVEGQLLTHALAELPTVRDGAVVADTARDLVKLAVVERHHATGRVGLGLVRGFGLHAGAFASTVAHDAHNVVVAGVDDADMAACVARLAELGLTAANVNGGGQVVAAGTASAIAHLVANPPARARVIELQVAGAFHTHFMAPAVPTLADAAWTIPRHDPSIAILTNADGSEVATGDDVVAGLIAQIARPVRWDLCMDTLVALGVTGMIELAPGGVLTGLAKRAR